MALQGQYLASVQMMLGVQAKLNRVRVVISDRQATDMSLTGFLPLPLDVSDPCAVCSLSRQLEFLFMLCLAGWLFGHPSNMNRRHRQ